LKTRLTTSMAFFSVKFSFWLKVSIRPDLFIKPP
jgi:hypothetical protein